ncbi:prismalin-14-like [Anopheles bellator]|uniref:prismalin-14-like n=1 Tax=Anopheles bellator TaxID=139047 RepID=UPI002648B556|nr:prismalin-14-like [Anopheles bellator]
MKVFIASVALVLLAVAEVSYAGGVVAGGYASAWPVTSSVAYPAYGVYGKSVLPWSAKSYSYPAAYNSWPVASKVVSYAGPAWYGDKLWSYDRYGYGSGYGYGGYGYGDGWGYGYGKAYPSKYWW